MWQAIHNIFTPEGIAPNTYVIENKILNQFIAALTQNEASYQLVLIEIILHSVSSETLKLFKIGTS